MSADPNPAPTPRPDAERWPAGSPDGRARRAALEAMATVAARPTSMVAYQCAGELLIIGQEPAAAAAVESLPDGVACTALVPARDGERALLARVALAGEGAREFTVVEASLEAVSGHLGAFAAEVSSDGTSLALARAAGRGRDDFDLVLDLGRSPQLRHEVAPPGYFAPGGDEAAFHRAIESIPDLVGEFDKPAYVDYDPAICAHGERGQRGCTRCLDACPTVAILSIGERVSVDPHLCQGTGGCASACPTGAMGYAYPRRPDALERLRRALEAYRTAGAAAPLVVAHDADAGAAQIERLAEVLPHNVIPFEVEEIGVVGLDTCLAALAYGACGVALLATAATPATTLATIGTQLLMTARILEGLAVAPDFALVIAPGEDAEVSRAIGAISPIQPVSAAGFRPQDDKRAQLRLVVDHLYAEAAAPATEVELPAGAPFGEIRVDRDACTLCMACIAVCPVKALDHGDERLQLKFRESACVQCGLCASACPEKAVSLAPRFVLDPEQRRATRMLNEDEPFRCIECGKPFGSPRLIERMTERLAGHRMFAGDAVNRIKMCEDCRVKDMF